MSQKLRPLDETVDVPDYIKKYCSGAWHIDSAEQFAVEYNALAFLQRRYSVKKWGISENSSSTCCAYCLRIRRWDNVIARQCYRFFKSARREAKAYVKRQAYIPRQDSGHRTRVFARLAVGLNFLAVETKCEPGCVRWSRSSSRGTRGQAQSRARSQNQSQAKAEASTASKTAEQEEAPPCYKAAIGMGHGC
ncbi:hypothetical protein BO82DRAFT_366061 [Aspergillus uvarum CBS 121591]|uniref:Uncharacterized protein n=1 Tax=Aspergillus uvarum CBS 121591 TaxID=1448315 RepID=A0A319C8K2_9EURO|nr:hypothetical protein BO82DRAFT_366061 [Aspergillus uvarum CBS 121591]PYH80271.1 hypothetical protein BO82DRAFT_366061 [Aspergillus uvarum CBS 121591]